MFKELSIPVLSSSRPVILFLIEIDSGNDEPYYLTNSQNNSELDVLVHLQEISYSRVNHPDEIFNIGEKHDLKVISIDESKLQIGCSIKQLSPDPFEHISNYEIVQVEEKSLLSK